jgi:hypothetical protein
MPMSFAARSLSLVAAAALASPAIAFSQEPRMEFTPLAGYRVGGEFRAEAGVAGTNDLEDGGSFALDIGLYRDATSFYEVFYNRRDAGLRTADEALRDVDIRVEYFHLGGTLLFPQARGYTGYVSLTAGLTRLDARSGGYDTERKPSASLGGGVRFPWTDALQATFGLRGYMTLVDSDRHLICISADGQAECLLRASGRTWWEAEAQAGLTFRF